MTSKHHGMAYGQKINDLSLEFYTCYTLFDITNTGIVMPYNPNLPNFMDDAAQPIVNLDTWERSRNQQRNWDTIIQTLSLRAQLINLEIPKIKMINSTLTKFDPNYQGPLKTWVFKFAVEMRNVYRKLDNPIGLLVEDCHLVPMCNNLKEEVDLTPSCLITQGQHINTYFEFEQNS